MSTLPKFYVNVSPTVPSIQQQKREDSMILAGQNT